MGTAVPLQIEQGQGAALAGLVSAAGAGSTASTAAQARAARRASGERIVLGTSGLLNLRW